MGLMYIQIQDVMGPQELEDLDAMQIVRVV